MKETYCAYISESIQKYLWFVLLLLPLGFSRLTMSSLIDVDKTGFYMKSILSKYGGGHTSYRVQHPLHYTHTNSKENVILTNELGKLNVDAGEDRSWEPRATAVLDHNHTRNFHQYVFSNFIDSMVYNIEDLSICRRYDKESYTTGKQSN